MTVIYFFLVFFQVSRMLEVESKYRNPYEEKLDYLASEFTEFYKMSIDCLDNSINQDKFITGESLKDKCLGSEFSIINRIYEQKMKSVAQIYEKLIIESFDIVDLERMSFFIECFKDFLTKGYSNIYQSMEIAIQTPGQIDNKEYFNELMEQSRQSIEYITEYHKLLIQAKIKNQQQLELILQNRDKEIQKFENQDKQQQNDNNKSKDQEKTPEEKIQQLNDQIEKETEEVLAGKNVKLGEDGLEMKDEYGDNVYGQDIKNNVDDSVSEKDEEIEEEIENMMSHQEQELESTESGDNSAENVPLNIYEQNEEQDRIKRNNEFGKYEYKNKQIQLQIYDIVFFIENYLFIKDLFEQIKNYQTDKDFL